MNLNESINRQRTLMGLDPIVDTEPIDEGFLTNVGAGIKTIAGLPKLWRDHRAETNWKAKTDIVNNNINKIKNLVSHATDVLDQANSYLGKQNRSSQFFNKFTDEHKKLDNILTKLNDAINDTSTPYHNNIQPTTNTPPAVTGNTVTPQVVPQQTPQQIVKPPANIVNNPSALAAWNRKHNPGLNQPVSTKKKTTQPTSTTQPISTQAQLDKDNEYLNNLYKQQQRAKKKKK